MRQQQVIGALLVCLLIAIIAASVVLVPRLVPDNAEQETFTQADSLLADSLLKQWEAKHPTYQKKTYQKKTYKKPEPVPLRLHYFDPNTADSLSLLELGLKPWQAKNLLRYREKGGRYREPADFRKLYGMTDSMYQALEPWIRIETIIEEDTVAQPVVKTWHEKCDTVLELNQADTFALQYIRGIGPFRAKQIVRYREQLGGFHHVEQLAEIKGMPVDSLKEHFTVDTACVRQISVIRATLSQLSRHPYIRYEQAKAIDDLRHRRKIRGEQDLLKRQIFTEEELEKLRPYLNYEK